MKLNKTACSTVKKCNSPLSNPSKKQRKMAINSISTTFYKGDQVALVGNNGAGKSSLLEAH